ncbi:thioesterase II family protein [Moorena sp. SIO3H5]|uniref:thioesterase II family protein n=1 Tax=Moorena sp. SIO3H5 TaxID=2607834 RepID=UPI0013BDCBDE|nr:thioesterase II family protein [Moorena sp. SIO3H5]NEO72089.1 thioesterase [Moorena sp. SIO3H5]
MTTTNSWITRPKPNPKARLRLFCFPFAGGAASSFRTWPDQLVPDIEVCPVELPGRGKRLREPLFTGILPLIETLTPALLPYLDIPFAFFGHSLGTIISFELARQLRREKAPSPQHLFISGRRAPQVPPRKRPLHNLPKSELIEELRQYNGTPETVLANQELMELFLPILRADFGINENYTYTSEPPLNCPISVFGGLEDTDANSDELAAWGDQTSSTFTIDMFPGGHFFINNKKECNQLLELITKFAIAQR